MTDTITIILFHVFIAFVSYIIWWPLSIIIPLIFFVRYWYRAFNLFDFTGKTNPTPEEIASEGLIKCKACKEYFKKEFLQEHILAGAISELELLETIHFPQVLFAGNFHCIKYKKLLCEISESGKKYEIRGLKLNTQKAIIEGNSVKIFDVKENKLEKTSNLKCRRKWMSPLMLLAIPVWCLFLYFTKMEGDGLTTNTIGIFALWLSLFAEEKTWY